MGQGRGTDKARRGDGRAETPYRSISKEITGIAVTVTGADRGGENRRAGGQVRLWANSSHIGRVTEVRENLGTILVCAGKIGRQAAAIKTIQTMARLLHWPDRTIRGVWTLKLVRLI